MASKRARNFFASSRSARIAFSLLSKRSLKPCHRDGPGELGDWSGHVLPCSAGRVEALPPRFEARARRGGGLKGLRARMESEPATPGRG